MFWRNIKWQKRIETVGIWEEGCGVIEKVRKGLAEKVAVGRVLNEVQAMRVSGRKCPGLEQQQGGLGGCSREGGW